MFAFLAWRGRVGAASGMLSARRGGLSLYAQTSVIVLPFFPVEDFFYSISSFVEKERKNFGRGQKNGTFINSSSGGDYVHADSRGRCSSNSVC